MKLHYYKRLNKRGEILQLWLVKTIENIVYHDEWYKITSLYYGEGLRPGEMIEVEIDEFREIACKYNCLSTDNQNHPRAINSY